MNQIAISFGTFFFDNVFLTPPVIDAGVVVPGAELGFELWHSFTDAKALAGVTQSGAFGVELNGITSGTLYSFTSIPYVVSLGQASAVIDYKASFGGSGHSTLGNLDEV